jgi:hypothetical protein
MKNNQLEALTWITNILITHNVPFQIAGGLAANVYGSRRPLEDIDIDIPDDKFSVIQHEVAQHIIFGPAQYKDENWDLLLMTLDYHGQIIDLSGAYSTKCWNKKTGNWQIIATEFQNIQIKNIFGFDFL